MSDSLSTRHRLVYLKRLSLDALDNYQQGLEDLDRLVADMKSIIESLQEIADPSWTKRLLKTWGDLEILYALVLAEGRTTLTEKEEVDVHTIVENFRSEFS